MNKTRKIKFRGKRVDNSEWVYGVPLLIKYEDLIPDIFACIITGVEHSPSFGFMSPENRCFVAVIPETIGQYTGLNDYNGKEIYEGDVWQEEDDCPRVVTWHEDNSCFYLEPTEANHDTSDFYSTHCKNGTIIGNIHDKQEGKG